LPDPGDADTKHDAKSNDRNKSTNITLESYLIRKDSGPFLSSTVKCSREVEIDTPNRGKDAVCLPRDGCIA
ncbi:hypothetical protein KCU91_g26, partial [Aureobasidium melanogenum]